tara:strand:- start:746 stop:1102 length:357 start_codon:yes stop_codon:yes gene_type:complete
MTTLDIESGLPPKAFLFPPYLEERITSPPEVQKTLIAPAPPSTTTMEIPANPNGTAATTPSDTMYKINIGDVQHEQILDSLPQPPFFSMASVFKPFTFSRPSSAESVAALLPPGPDQC